MKPSLSALRNVALQIAPQYQVAVCISVIQEDNVVRASLIKKNAETRRHGSEMCGLVAVRVIVLNYNPFHCTFKLID